MLLGEKKHLEVLYREAVKVFSERNNCYMLACQVLQNFDVFQLLLSLCVFCKNIFKRALHPNTR